MKIFGIDPGSERTGYGCIETHRQPSPPRHLRLAFGSRPFDISRQAEAHPRRLWSRCCDRHRPDCVAVENIFYARNVRSALKLGHARGVALLAASEAGLAGRRVRAGRDQARGRRLRPRGEAPGPADGQAAARARRAAVAARCGRRARRGDLPRAQRDRDRSRSAPPSNATACDAAIVARLIRPVIALLRGSASSKRHPKPADRRRRRGWLRRAGAAVDVLRARRAGHAGHAADPHARPRRRDRALRVRHAARTESVRAADRISGIGPKLALAVLSGIEPADLIRAIRLQDVARLTAIPGIGKKTAERIGLELKDRLPATLQAAGRSAPAARHRRISCATTCCRRC